MDSEDSQVAEPSKDPIQFTSLLFRTSSNDGGLLARFETHTSMYLPKGTEIYYSQNAIENSYLVSYIYLYLYDNLTHVLAWYRLRGQLTIWLLELLTSD
jgi:hypothetical protein